MKKLEDYRLNPQNPRKISPEQLEKLKKSIQDFPAMLKYRPIVVGKDNIILGGNMRFIALKELGYTEVDDGWIVKATDITPKRYNEFIIKDNVEFGESDFSKLSDMDYDELLGWGFNIDELNEYIAQNNLPDDDDWARAFDKDTLPTELAGLKQMTFILHESKVREVLDTLKTYASDKNEALLKALGIEDTDDSQTSN